MTPSFQEKQKASADVRPLGPQPPRGMVAICCCRAGSAAHGVRQAGADPNQTLAMRRRGGAAIGWFWMVWALGRAAFGEAECLVILVTLVSHHNHHIIDV